jgi:hypothetical protein
MFGWPLYIRPSTQVSSEPGDDTSLLSDPSSDDWVDCGNNLDGSQGRRGGNSYEIEEIEDKT